MRDDLETYAEDRERLLLELRRQGWRAWVPARLVRRAILLCGWRIERCHGMASSLLGLCCPESQVIQVPTDFRQRLRVPQTARAVMNETLAHELGHLRLHAPAMLKHQTKQRGWEKEANDYARVFLVPLLSLLNRLPMELLLKAEDDVQRWRLVLRLADEFEVTGWFMGSALEMYGLAHISHRRRLVRIQPLAHELVRRFAFARTA